MQEEIIYGINPVTEALRGSRRAFELFVHGEGRKVDEIVKLAHDKGVGVRRRDKRDITTIAGTEHHQGVALRVEEFPYVDLHDVIDDWKASGKEGFFLVLDGIQDPHNLGALVRTAACAGADAVIIPKDRSASMTPVAEKVSAGAASMIPIARVTNLAMILDDLKKEGFWVFGAAGEAGSSLYEANFRGNTVIAIGNEGEGLRPLVKKKCDVLISIPMSGGPGSLNASVAGGVILFEVMKSRLFAKK